jgi:thioredoxin-related protein
MNNKHLPFVLIVISLFSLNCSAQSNLKKRIQLQGSCFWDQKNRKIVDTLKDQVATVTKENNGKYLLLINGKKYLPCNLPKTLNDTTILITGYVLQTLQTEKVIATPIKLIKAYSN